MRPLILNVVCADYFATASSFFITENMKIAESKQHAMKMLHTPHKGRSPQKLEPTLVR